MIDGMECSWVICPNCGKPHQRSVSTNSLIQCKHCHHKHYAYVHNGIVLEVPADSQGNGQLYLMACRLLSGDLDAVPEDKMPETEDTGIASRDWRNVGSPAFGGA